MMSRFINGLNCSFIYAKTVVKRKIYGNLRQTVSKTSKTGRFFAILYVNFKIGYIFFQKFPKISKNFFFKNFLLGPSIEHIHLLL